MAFFRASTAMPTGGRPYHPGDIAIVQAIMGGDLVMPCPKLVAGVVVGNARANGFVVILVIA
jgi:hypothetical protein